MIFDLQKASMWKRISAWLFDMILLGMLVVGIACAMSALLGYDNYSQAVDSAYARYESEYGVTFALSGEEYSRLTPDQQQLWQEAYDALTADRQAMHAYSMMVSLALTITSLSILAGFLILELAVPLLLHNGQTLGKKIFGVGVIRTDGVKLSPVQLFIRTVLGKYTIETMVPVLTVMLIFFGTLGRTGTVLLLGLAVVQIILMAATRTNSPIHDCLAGTVAVDLQSQMVFESREAMIEYKKQMSAEAAARSPY